MYYKGGELIKLLRLQRGLSQERLAEGIIERSNLSKAERGKHELTKEKMDALLERLGHTSIRRIPYALNDEEHRIFTLRDKLDAYFTRHNLENVEKLVAEMEEIPAFQEDLHKQYLLKIKGTLHLYKQDRDFRYALKLLKEAIRVTIPNFDAEHPRFYFLTHQDIEIINQIASMYGQTGETDKAIELLERAIICVKKNVLDEHEKARSLALLLFSLSNIFMIKQQFDYMLKICNEAIDACKNNRVYGMMPNFLFNKARSLFYLRQKEEVKSLFLQAYYCALAQGQDLKATHFQEYAKENLRINLIEENS